MINTTNITGEDIVEAYLKWIKDNTFFNKISNNNVVKISVPFLDRHNDYIEVYIKNAGKDKVRLTDDGATIADLLMSGMEMNSPKRQQVFYSILRGHGVQIEKDELYVDTDIKNIGYKKHNLIQAILAVNDMAYLSRESVASFFKEDVELFFLSKEILFTKDIKLTGKSGFDHTLDFIIPKSSKKDERIIKIMNKANRSNIESSIFAFSDLQGTRENAKNIVMYNDLAMKPAVENLEALEKYEVFSIPWTDRNSQSSLQLLSN